MQKVFLSPHYIDPFCLRRRGDRAAFTLIELLVVIAVIAILMMGGMYSGLFTATEAAAAGALFSLVFGFGLREIKGVGVVVKAMKDAANTTAMLFLINIGALYYSRILAMTRVPTMITEALRDWQVSPFVVLVHNRPTSWMLLPLITTFCPPL